MKSTAQTSQNYDPTHLFHPEDDMLEMHDVGVYCETRNGDTPLSIETVRIGSAAADEWYVWVDEGDNCDYYHLRASHGSREAAQASAEALIKKRDNAVVPPKIAAAYAKAYLQIDPTADPADVNQTVRDLWDRWRWNGYPLVYEYMNYSNAKRMDDDSAIAEPEIKGGYDAWVDLGYDVQEFLSAWC